MQADKYKQKGAYHWDWYGKRSTFTRHVDFLKRYVREPNTIEISAGDGFMVKQLGIKGVESSPTALRLASRKGVKLDFGDPYNLPYKDEQFESALFSDTINQMTSATKALTEARRVIKKYLYASIPSSGQPIDLGDVQYSWKANQFKTFVEKHGFRLIDGPRLKADRLRVYFKFEKTNVV